MQRKPTASHAKVGLGVNDFVYPIITLFVSGMDLVHRHGGKQGTMRSAYMQLFALQFLFSRFISFRVVASVFRPPTQPCLYMHIATFSLQIHIE